MLASVDVEYQTSSSVHYRRLQLIEQVGSQSGVSNSDLHRSSVYGSPSDSSIRRRFNAKLDNSELELSYITTADTTGGAYRGKASPKFLAKPSRIM